jgi:hypothetical protein
MGTVSSIEIKYDKIADDRARPNCRDQGLTYEWTTPYAGIEVNASLLVLVAVVSVLGLDFGGRRHWWGDREGITLFFGSYAKKRTQLW